MEAMWLYELQEAWRRRGSDASSTNRELHLVAQAPLFSPDG